MAEIIDFMLIFWAGLGVVVFFAGRIFEQQQKQASKAKQRKEYNAKPSTTNLDDFSGANYWQSATSRKFNDDRSENATARLGSRHDQFYHNNSSSAAQPIDDTRWSRGETTRRRAYDQWQPQQLLADEHMSTTNCSGAPLAANRMADALVSNELNSSLGQQEPMQFGRRLSSSLAPSCASVPTATGFNADCVEWVNSILYLFYKQAHKYGPIIAESVCRSLNEKLSNVTHTSGEHSHLIIEFTGINFDLSTRPELTNVRTEIESDKSISACCKIYNKRISFDLSVQQFYSGIGAGNELQADFFGHNRPLRYELVLENLEGKLKSMAVLSDKLLVAQFMEKPDMKISLIKSFADTSLPGSRIISDDTLVQLILQAITQVVVDLYFGDDVDFPRFTRQANKSGTIKNKLSNILKLGSTGASDIRHQLKQEFLSALSAPDSSHSNRGIFVKILKASNINYNHQVTCLIELDSPLQQALSSTKPGNSNPTWDEHFLFQLTDSSRELSVELWDAQGPPPQSQQSGPASKRSASANKRATGRERASDLKAELTQNNQAKFLGQARVCVRIDELNDNPVQRLCVPLHPMGGQAHDLNNSVGGELALELLYLDNLARSPSNSPSPSPSAGLRKSTSASSLACYQSAAYSPGDLISIDRKLTPSGYIITTTTITKSQANRRSRARKAEQQRAQRNNSYDELVARADTPAADRSSSAAGDARSEGQAESLAARSAPGAPLRRSRSRSLLRAIKKRFSFSRARSRSLGPTGAGDAAERDDADSDLRTDSVTPASGRSETAYYSPRARISSEMSTLYQLDGRAKSVPASRDSNEVPTIVINKGRLSDTASALTFTHPKSQLVVEVREPTLERQSGGAGAQKLQTRYYAVPEKEANKRKWSKRGVKLHLFNEHQFVACHLAGSSTCHLCGRVFSRRPGKQGYKCRNCHLLSHKQCHVKVDHNCPYAAGNELQLEYIDADPPADLANQLVGNQTSEAEIAADQQHSGAQSVRAFGRPTMARTTSLETGYR